MIASASGASRKQCGVARAGKDGIFRKLGCLTPDLIGVICSRREKLLGPVTTQALCIFLNGNVHYDSALRP